jgi:hypothetical protein
LINDHDHVNKIDINKLHNQVNEQINKININKLRVRLLIKLISINYVIRLTIRKFLGRSIHPKPRRLGLVWKYVEFDTSKCVDKYPYETTHFIIEICGFPRFPYIIKFHWKSVEFYSGICGIHPQILLRNSRNY